MLKESTIVDSNSIHRKLPYMDNGYGTTLHLRWLIHYADTIVNLVTDKKKLEFAADQASSFTRSRGEEGQIL